MHHPQNHAAVDAAQRPIKWVRWGIAILFLVPLVIYLAFAMGNDEKSDKARADSVWLMEWVKTDTMDDFEGVPNFMCMKMSQNSETSLYMKGFDEENMRRAIVVFDWPKAKNPYFGRYKSLRPAAQKGTWVLHRLESGAWKGHMANESTKGEEIPLFMYPAPADRCVT